MRLIMLYHGRILCTLSFGFYICMLIQDFSSKEKIKLQVMGWEEFNDGTK